MVSGRDKIAFTSNRNAGQDEIYVMNADGSSQTRVTNVGGDDLGPSWSPDGSRMAFTSNRDGNNEVFVMNADGTGQTQLTTSATDINTYVSWQPTNQILWDRVALSGTANDDVWAMNPDGTGKVALTSSTANETMPEAAGPDLFAAPPSFIATTPASPANNNSPLVRGTAEAGSTVDLYTNPTCTSAVAGSGSAAAFASPGIPVNVADDTTTTLWGKVTDASLNVSACSPTSIAYVEDSAPPASPTITSAPAPDPGTTRAPSWSFTGEGGGSFQCELRRGATVVSAFSVCASPKSYDLTAQPYGTYTFAVRQIDALGNGPGPEASATYRLVAGGNRIVFSLDNGTSQAIYTMNPDGTGQTQLTPNGTGVHMMPTWAPDGSKIFWVRYDTADLWSMNVDGSARTQLTSGAPQEMLPDVSPDGSKVVFNNYDGNRDIWVMNPDGTGRTRLTTDPAQDEYAEWSPDGTKIIFSSNRTGNYEIWVMNPDGTGQTQVTSAAGSDDQPSWSPDGSKITFRSDRNGDPDIWVMNANGSGQTMLMNDTALDSTPSWQPGNKIYFSSLRGSAISHVYQINPDGTGLSRLTTNAGAEYNAKVLGPDIFAGPPTFIGTTPASPANNNSPLVRGSAETGGTVELYTNSACTSAVAASGSAATFASPGIAVIVTDNTSTTFWAKATDPSLNVSACSPTSITYVEDSTPPGAPTITVSPAPDPGYRSNVSWSFTGEAGATFECELSMGVTVISPFVPCTSPRSYALTGGDGTYTFKVRQTDAAGNGPSSAASDAYTLDSASAKIVYSSTADGNLDVYTIKPDGTGAFQVTNDGGVLQSNQAGWSPDRSQILYTNDATGALEIWKVNAGGTGKVQLTPSPYDDGFPDWSPDGTKIVFYSTRFPSGVGDIYVMNAEGTGTVRLTTAASVDDQPDWSPDGSKILFRSQRDGNAEIYVMNADGTGQTRLTNNTSLDATPQWFPDGSRISFYTDRDGNSEIYVMNADGSGQTRLTSVATADYFPVWSPDGSQIAFITTRDGNSEIYLMNPDGTAQTRVTNTPGATETDPDWFTASSTDITAPAPPNFAATSPPSPANNNAPFVSGTSEAGSTVRIYTNSTCTSSVAATGSAASFSSPGLSVAVADNTSTALYATATDAANNTSACSPTSIAYLEDSAAPPVPTLGAGPGASGSDPTPTWTFSGEAGASFSCELRNGATVISAFAPCTSPATFDLSAQPDATYTFSVVATDPAGNASPPAASTYALDRSAPPVPTLGAGPGPSGSDPTPTWTFTGEAGASFTCQLTRGVTVVSPTAACTSPATFYLSAQPDATYTFSVVATDPAGNASAPTTSDYTLDRAPAGAPTLNSSPPAVGTDSTPTWSFNGEAGATFECRLSRGTTVMAGLTACLSPHTYDLSSQPDGVYTFSVRQLDPAGNPSAEATSTYALDRTAPPAPALGTGPGTTGSDSDPTWAFSGEAGARFTCELNQGSTVIAAAAPCTSPATFDLTAQPDATYTFTVVAIDPAGNASAPATSDYALDRVPSGAPVLSGSPGPAGSDPTPSWSFSAEPGASFTCQLQRGSTLILATAPCTSPATFDLTAQPDGTYTFTVVAIDPAGNASAPTTSDYALDRVVPPAAVLVSAPPPVGSDPTPTWSFTGEPGARFTCELRRGTTVISAAGACTSPTTFDLTAQPDGTYNLVVVVTDPAGNSSPPTAATYTLDRTDPALPTLSSGPGPVGSDPTPTWSFTGEPGATFTCELKQGGTVIAPAASCTSPISYDLSTQPDGTYTLTLVQTDPAANSSIPISIDYLLDRLAPSPPTLTSSPPPSGADASPTWSFVGEPGSLFECELARGATVVVGYSPCADPFSFDLSGQPDGTYTFKVRQRDPAGNVSGGTSSGYDWASPPAPAPGPTGGGAVTPPVPSSEATPTPSSQATPSLAPIGGKPSTLPDPGNAGDLATTASAQPPPAAGTSQSPARTPAPAPAPGTVAGDRTDHGLSAANGRGTGDGRRQGSGRPANGSSASWVDAVLGVVLTLLGKTAFPLVLVLVVMAFLAIQDRIDRADPKLANAPLHNQLVDFG